MLRVLIDINVWCDMELHMTLRRCCKKMLYVDVGLHVSACTPKHLVSTETQKSYDYYFRDDTIEKLLKTFTADVSERPLWSQRTLMSRSDHSEPFETSAAITADILKRSLRSQQTFWNVCCDHSRPFETSAAITVNLLERSDAITADLFKRSVLITTDLSRKIRLL